MLRGIVKIVNPSIIAVTDAVCVLVILSEAAFQAKRSISISTGSAREPIFTLRTPDESHGDGGLSYVTRKYVVYG
jgi:hypothetical protein